MEDQFRAEKLSECLQKNIPFAVFRQPGEKIKRILINDCKEEQNQEKTCQDSPIFIFHPYGQGRRQKKIILKGLYDEYEGRLEAGDLHSGLFCGKVKLTENNQYFAGKEEFCEQVAKATIILKTSSLKKVVLSRIRFRKRIPGFGFFRFYDEICSSLPDSYAYICFHPDCGLWCGASPELLLKYSDNRVETVSLAGTKNAEILAENITEWDEKEIIEQQLVTDYITDVFRRNGLINITISGPFTARAGNVCHLKTCFSAKTESGFRPLNFARLLHPTPAVCGLPEKMASQYIKSEEKHERGYYTGFMGALYPGEDAVFYVNLRCLQVLEDGFALYAGAGITADSVPEKEWVETGRKTETLLRIIENQKRP